MNKQEEYIKLLEDFIAAEKVYFDLIRKVSSFTWEVDKRSDSLKPLTKERLKKIREAQKKKDEAEVKLNSFRLKE